MAATRQGLDITGAYQSRLQILVKIASRETRHAWQNFDLDEIDESYGPVRKLVTASVERAQAEAVRLTAGYLGAFLSAELGEAVMPPVLARNAYVGQSFAGLPLDESLDKPRIAAKVAIQDSQDDPAGTALRSLLANVDLDVKAAARAALHDQIASDDRIEGWERAIRGTCAACAGVKDGTVASSGTSLRIHPNCQCVAEPSVVSSLRRGKPITRQTGQQLFDSLDSTEQDAMIGAAAAEKIRKGEATLADFVEHSAPGETPGFIRQKPVDDL